MSQLAPWVYAEYQFTRGHGEKILTGRMMGAASPLTWHPFQAPYNWADEHESYRLEIFGRDIASDDEARRVPDEAIWRWFLGPPTFFDVAAWRTRAIHPKASIFAQTDWCPNWPTVELSYGGGLPGDTRAAVIGLTLLQDIALKRSGPHAMSDEDALKEAVRFGLEWLQDNPTKLPQDFSRRHFATKRCTGIDAANKWMTDKHFGIKQVQQEIARRIGQPT